MMNKLLTSVALIGLALPSLASAADKSGKFYASLNSDYIFSADADIDSSSTAGRFGGSHDYNDSYAVGGAVGYYYTDDLRLETEINYRSFNAETPNPSATVTTDDTEVWSFMANVAYNFDTRTKVEPYVLAGIGVANDDLTSEKAFAYQAGVGLDYNLTDQHTIYGGYHYFGTDDFEHTSVVSGTRFDTDVRIESHALRVGYRYTF